MIEVSGSFLSIILIMHYVWGGNCCKSRYGRLNIFKISINICVLMCTCSVYVVRNSLQTARLDQCPHRAWSSEIFIYLLFIYLFFIRSHHGSTAYSGFYVFRPRSLFHRPTTTVLFAGEFSPSFGHQIPGEAMATSEPRATGEEQDPNAANLRPPTGSRSSHTDHPAHDKSDVASVSRS